MPIKYNFFLDSGAGALPLATPARGPVQPFGTRKHRGLLSSLEDGHLPLSISKWIGATGCNLRLLCALAATVMF